MNAKIDAKDVRRNFTTKSGEVEALGPFTMQIEEGEFVCIVGPSGCGKSTMLRVVGGLLNPSSGSVRIRHDGPESQAVSIVFQDYSIYAWKTVEANIRLGLDIAKVPREEANERVERWLRRMGLWDFRKAYPQTLSGGMRQRVSLARALVVEPDILLMDEPFAALDAQMRAVMQEELLAICQAEKRTVLFVTHSLDEAILLADRVFVMSARPGRLLAGYDVPFERPRTPDLRGTEQFAHLENEIWTLLRNEVNRDLTNVAADGRSKKLEAIS
ncbi:ABC transporter ATP-binding protein [Acrocarpospora catenulata]|uniref:ABC transporter ATP-binding protein n=1 Tax=Acrocarpospora catenulata TaxID=2836182 RepID=UPI001BD995F7|nr:ABC transporter ATP-binding protein [Acrocarpospora catenulata]